MIKPFEWIRTETKTPIDGVYVLVQLNRKVRHHLRTNFDVARYDSVNDIWFSHDTALCYAYKPRDVLKWAYIPDPDV